MHPIHKHLHLHIHVCRYAIEDPAETSITFTARALLNLLIGCYVLFALIFLYFVIRSYKREDHGVKKILYLKLCFLYSLWFFLPPLTEWGVYALDDW